MEIISRTMTVSLNIEDCEKILSWYKSEQEMLLKWNVSSEWKNEQTAESVFTKMKDNYNLAYQFMKIPRWWELNPPNREIIKELELIYNQN